MSVDAGTGTTIQGEDGPVDISGVGDVQPPAPAAPSPAAGVEVRPDTIRRATLDALLNKAKRTDEFTVTLPQKSGEKEIVSFALEAVTGPEYDALVSKCPPNREQAARGMQYDPEEFEPLLASAVIVDPKIEKADWKKVRKLDEWSGGEWASLINRCIALCMQGLDVPFINGG